MKQHNLGSQSQSAILSINRQQRSFDRKFASESSFTCEMVLQSAAPRCPCCAFLSDDLFLPNPVDAAGSDNRAIPNEQSTSSHVLDAVSPQQAYDKLLTETRSVNVSATPEHPLVLVDTHGHAHLQRDYVENANNDSTESVYHIAMDDSKPAVTLFSITCAVEEADWDTCITYASQSTHRIAALGIHPWYLAKVADALDADGWLVRLEQLLQKHPGVMVGEIGLCKVAKFVRTYAPGKAAALALQRRVFQAQLRLAIQYHRPVSIHCVHQQSVLLDVLRETISNEACPAAVALHSFTGTAHHVRQLLQWEATLERTEPLLYFGFSHAVNDAMCTADKARRQGRDAVRAVPIQRLLVESDVHAPSDVLGGTMGAAAYVAAIRDESIAITVRATTQNALRFCKSICPTNKRNSMIDASY